MPLTYQPNPIEDTPISLIRTEFRNLSLRDVLNQSPKILLGVTAAAETALGGLSIKTVFDLATSGVFDDACRIVAAGSDVHDPNYQHGSPTSDLVKPAMAAGHAIGELQFLSIDALARIPSASVAAIKQALDVDTVRDLALYPGFHAALKILTVVYFPENEAAFDPESPPDLMPKTGEYPTERVQYTTLVLDEIPLEPGVALMDLDAKTFKPVDLALLARMDAGFKRVAYGALLTFNQSWFAQGVTLGQLLHSTSLAPGESTRIAVVDWTRKSRAGETEVIDETDALSQDTSQNRAISEVTSAVANEAQGGFSKTNTNSKSSQSGSSSAEELSAPLGGLFGGPSGSAGQTSSDASSSSEADSYSSSFGHRDLGSSMMQNVNDTTHQQAHDSRSRRASVVKEVSQTEHEGVSTRVLANYNHMHALTIQYYEVVQVYRVEVALVKADRVVFIPFQLVDFNDDNMLRRFQSILVRAALTYPIRQALLNLDMIEIALDTKAHFSGLGMTIAKFSEAALASSTNMSVFAATMSAAPTPADAPASAPAPGPGTRRAAQVRLTPRVVASVVQDMNSRLWEVDNVSRLGGLLNLTVLRPNSSSLFLPGDTMIEGASVNAEAAPVGVVVKDAQGATISNLGPDSPIHLSAVSRIALTGSNAEADVQAHVVLTVNRNGVRFPVQLPSVVVKKGAKGETPLVLVKPGGADVNLKNHLMANRMYYSRAIYRALDSSQMALLLSSFGVHFQGKLVPVAQVVEPKPLRIVGNYLAFKMNSDPSGDPEWAKWLESHGIRLGSTKEDIVPLGTGGTFAEAILGRSNCAEKLDITRFWNWQDSPIPLQPSDIAAIQTGSRATPEDVKPGQLSTPIINITAPASLPDPVGTAAVLSAIQNGSMFRDMSGMQATIGLAQAALQATAAGASTAGQQAGTNMNSLLTANTERQRIAADMISSLAKTAASALTGVPMGGGGGTSGGSNHSQDGAKINYFDKTAGQSGGGATGGGTAGGGGAPVGPGGSSSGGSGGRPGGASNAGGGGGQQQFSQNPAALAATWGDSQPPASLISRVLDTFTGDSASPTSGPPDNAWPKLNKTNVLTRIDTLKMNANLFNQGKLGLCTAAAFFHHAIQRKPDDFSSFAKALYGGGMGFLGKLKVSAGSDLRDADYSALLAKYSNMPPEADWMVMSSLRDSENWLFDFEGSPEETFSMDTSTKELSGWYKDTGFYSAVDYSTDTSVAGVKAISKTATNHVALWIKAKLLGIDTKATHMITVESAITIDEANDSIKFSYWTWGHDPVDSGSFKLSDFLSNYKGVITATF